MHALIVAAIALLAPVAAGPSKSAPGAAKPKASATCEQAPVRAVSVRAGKAGLEATAFIAGLRDVDRGAIGIETPGGLDVVPLAGAQEVRLAHFKGGEGGKLRIAIGGAGKENFTASIPTDLVEGTVSAKPTGASKLRVEVLVRRAPKTAPHIIVAVSGAKNVDGLSVALGSRRPTQVETGLRLSGASKGKPKARLGKGLYYLSFDNGNDTRSRNRWVGATDGQWTTHGAELVGGEVCADGVAKRNGGSRTYRRRIKKQMISTLQTYTRGL